MMYAQPHKDWTGWDYIEGNPKMSIATSRYYHLHNLCILNGNELKIAAKDKDTDAWTKWTDFYQSTRKDGMTFEQLRGAYDLHRGVLKNEIITESDYPTYEENYDAIKLIGAIIEKKGFIPHYYYSGNKSLHLHVYIDWTCFQEIDVFLQEKLIKMFKYYSSFKKKFIEWLRQKFISCWDMGLREFDSDLVRSSHLIRTEMSRNKLGYKTFLGYSYRDVSFIPYVCNEENRIYPKIAPVRLSNPHSPQELIEEFLLERDIKRRKQRVRRREQSLQGWIDAPEGTEMRPEVSYILSNEFKNVGDGFKRGMFILANELKRVFGEDQALIILNDWNGRMGFPVLEKEIEYRVRNKLYTLSNSYIREFLKSIGHIDIPIKCNRKI